MIALTPEAPEVPQQIRVADYTHYSCHASLPWPISCQLWLKLGLDGIERSHKYRAYVKLHRIVLVMAPSMPWKRASWQMWSLVLMTQVVPV
jgi:hypothetical protein